jgi:hypothetical protein
VRRLDSDSVTVHATTSFASESLESWRVEASMQWKTSEILLTHTVLKLVSGAKEISGTTWFPRVFHHEDKQQTQQSDVGKPCDRSCVNLRLHYEMVQLDTSTFYARESQRGILRIVAADSRLVKYLENRDKLTMRGARARRLALHCNGVSDAIFPKLGVTHDVIPILRSTSDILSWGLRRSRCVAIDCMGGVFRHTQTSRRTRATGNTRISRSLSGKLIPS